MIKSLFTCFWMGFGLTLGSIAVTKGFDIAKDPYKKAKMKDKFKKIKDAITD